MKKEPVSIRERAVKERIKGFTEVVLGYDESQTLQEAARCLQCKNPKCNQACPVGIDIKKFIYEITQKDYKAAYRTIREKNSFPSICGRVCPAEYQCRKACVLSKSKETFCSDEAINIHFLERFVGDFGMKQYVPKPLSLAPDPSKKVAIVGSGPAGLCASGELAKAGCRVTIFESLHKVGGVLRYGIPPFRLPLRILDAEIAYIKALGVTIVTNCAVGKTITLSELQKEYSYVLLGLGAGVPSFLGVPGENFLNVYSANEFLTRVNLMKAYQFPAYHTPVNVGKRIVVIGGGNTAMDAARVALRLQSLHGMQPEVIVLYRRTENEMPARRLEIAHAKEEGVQFNFLTQPKEFFPDERGYIQSLRVRKCELGEPDASGRRRPLEIPDSDYTISCDLAIIAVGLRANQLFTRQTPKISIDKYGDIVVSEDTMQTSVEGVYAAGDIVGGEGTVIEAMGMAKKAARVIISSIGAKR